MNAQRIPQKPPVLPGRQLCSGDRPVISSAYFPERMTVRGPGSFSALRPLPTEDEALIHRALMSDYARSRRPASRREVVESVVCTTLLVGLFAVTLAAWAASGV